MVISCLTCQRISPWGVLPQVWCDSVSWSGCLGRICSCRAGPRRFGGWRFSELIAQKSLSVVLDYQVRYCLPACLDVSLLSALAFIIVTYAHGRNIHQSPPPHVNDPRCFSLYWQINIWREQLWLVQPQGGLLYFSQFIAYGLHDTHLPKKRCWIYYVHDILLTL